MRLGGIVSGMDTEWVVSELMKLERQPIERVGKDIEGLEDTKEEWRQLNRSLQDFMSGLSALKERETYFAMTGSSNNDDINVSATPDARVSSYDLEVSQLAQTHMIASGPLDHIEHPDDVEASLDLEGELSFEMAGEDAPFTVQIEAVDSLIDIRDKINNSELVDTENGASDDRELPLEASIIGDRLVLETVDTGVEHQVTAIGGDEAVWGEDGLDLWGAVEDPENGDNGTENGDNNTENGENNTENDMGFTHELQTAQDAAFTINGLAFERGGNVIDDLIEEVTIDIRDLNIEDPEKPETARISVEQETDSAREAVEDFVESFNTLYSELQDKGRVVVDGDDIDTGPLQGDSMLRGLVRNLRTRVTDPINTEGLSLAEERDRAQLVMNELGIDVDRYGEMTFDASQFEDAQAEDINLVYEAFGGERGIASRLETYLEGVSYEEGARDGVKRETNIGSRMLSLERQVGRTEDRVAQMERRAEQREETLWNQFTRMEDSLNRIYSEGDWLRQQMWMMTF